MNEIQTEKEYYLESRKHTDDIRIKNINQYDYMLFVISTGSFVLSINYLSNKGEVLSHSWILIISWTCLILAIALQAVEYKVSIAQQEHIMDQLDEWKQKDFTPKFFAPEYKHKGLLNCIRLFGVFFLCSGIVLLTIFASLNIK